MKKYGLPLLELIISNILITLYQNYTAFPYENIIVTIMTTIALFMFGVYLNPSHGHKENWIKRIFIVILTVILVLMQLDIFKFPVVVKILSLIGYKSVVFYMFYVYFGYCFL